MDNGFEVFAKLPNPNAGPAHFTVASEVATRELVIFLYSLYRLFTKVISFETYSMFLFLKYSHGLVTLQ